MPKPQQFAQQIVVGGGLQTRLIDALVDEIQCTDVLNFEFSTHQGQATSRAGWKEWSTGTPAGSRYLLRKSYVSGSGLTDYFLAQQDDVIYRALGAGTTFTAVQSGFPQTFPDAAQFDDWTYLAYGSQTYRTSDGATFFQAGNSGPSTAPTLSAFGAGSAQGEYYGFYTYIYGIRGESPPSPASGGITFANNRARFTNVTAGPTGTTKRRLYLGHASEGSGYLLDSIPNNTATGYSSPAFREAGLGDPFDQGLEPTPKSRLCEFHGGRMWWVLNSDRSVLQPSVLLPDWGSVPDVIDSDEAFNDIRDFDGAKITALASLGDVMIILTETSCWALYGQSVASAKIQRIYEEGCPEGGHRTVQVINGKCYWKSRKNVFRTNGYREGTFPISLDIEPTMEDLDTSTGAISEWCAVDYRPRHWYMLFCSVATGVDGSGLRGTLAGSIQADGAIHPASGVGTWNTISNKMRNSRLCLVYDYQQGELNGTHKWTVFDLNAVAATTLNGAGDDNLCYFTSSGLGEVRQFERDDNTPADDTGSINAKMRHSWRTEAQFANEKRARKLWIIGKAVLGAETGYHGMAIDTGASIWVDSLQWSTQADVQRVWLPPEVTSEFIQVYTGHSSAATRLLLEAFGIDYKYLNRR